VPLAKKFDKIIQGSSYGPRLAKKPRLDSILGSDLEELSEDVFLEAIPRGERDILVTFCCPAIRSISPKSGVCRITHFYYG
jgi:hypothetical protein